MGHNLRLGPSGYRQVPAMAVAAGSVASSVLIHHGPQPTVLAVPVAPAAAGEDDLQPREGTADTAARYGIDLGELAARQGFDGQAGQVLSIELPRIHATGAPWQGLTPSLALVGVGEGLAADLRQSGAALARAMRRPKGAQVPGVVTTVASGGSPGDQQAFCEGFALGAYQAPSWGADEPAEAPGLTLLGNYDPTAPQSALAVAKAVWLARDLAHTPAHLKSPAWLVAQLRDLDLPPGVTLHIEDSAGLAARAMGGLLAVGAGATSEPALAIVQYRPATAGRHVALVGAGLTYDTGGMALKKREAMALTPADVSGAATALAVVLAAAELRIPVALSAVLPLAEHAADAATYRPGDVLSTADGTTVEVRDGGRATLLMLADALAYTAATVRPDVIVDIATSGEAATVGLGRHTAALYTSSRNLAAGLTASGTSTGERVWRMPLVEEYADALASPIAQVANASGDSHVAAGSALDALFLRRFAADVPWAHLDISGVAASTADVPTCPAGGTGFGVRCVLEWLAGPL